MIQQRFDEIHNHQEIQKFQNVEKDLMQSKVENEKLKLKLKKLENENENFKIEFNQILQKLKK